MSAAEALKATRAVGIREARASSWTHALIAP
jgi:hypothetical protein